MPTIEEYPDAKAILFNTEMVRAILDNRKSVTRRVIKFPKGMTGRLPEHVLKPDERPHLYYPCGIKFSPYKVGDILYVRETWNCLPIPEPLRGTSKTYWYKADDERLGDNWRPSTHMPKSAARIFLRVTGVRVERLQDISEGEARLEGVNPYENIENHTYLKEYINLHAFANLWDFTIPNKNLVQYGWAANPWVWVIEFERAGD